MPEKVDNERSGPSKVKAELPELPANKDNGRFAENRVKTLIVDHKYQGIDQ